MTLSLYFDIEPVPKQSARHYATKKHVFKDGKLKEKLGVGSYQTKEIKSFEAAIGFLAKRQRPDGFQITDKPITVESLTIAFKAPKSLKKADRIIIENGGWVWKDTQPDITDNLMKGLFDALQNIIYVNDNQIRHLKDVKRVWRKHAGISLTISY